MTVDMPTSRTVDTEMPALPTPASVTVSTGLGVGRKGNHNAPFSHSPCASARSAVPVNRPIDERGRSIRRVLLAVAQRCEARGLPLPTRRRLGLALGISAPQVTRHLGRLQRHGFLELQRIGRRNYAVTRRIAA